MGQEGRDEDRTAGLSWELSWQADRQWQQQQWGIGMSQVCEKLSCSIASINAFLTIGMLTSKYVTECPTLSQLKLFILHLFVTLTQHPDCNSRSLGLRNKQMLNCN